MRLHPNFQLILALSAAVPHAPLCAQQFGPGGFQLESADGGAALNIGADVQSDFRSASGTGGDRTLLRRLRPVFSGHFATAFEYYVRPDFAQGKPVLYDAWLQWNHFDRFRIRAGKFKPPTGLERLQQDDDTTFVERGLPTLLAPMRALGVQFSGDLVNRKLSYQAGLFHSVPDNGIDSGWPGGHPEYAGRLFATPFQTASETTAGQTPMSGAGFGLAAAAGSLEGTALPAYKTVAQMSFFKFNSGVEPAGFRTTLAPQAFYYAGPLGVLAEDTAEWTHFRKGSVRTGVALQSWQVEVSWILTGEKKSFDSPVPRHPFAPQNGGWGAWEIAARTGAFRVDRGLFAAGLANPAASPGQAREWLGGVNWYLNRLVRISMNYGRTSFLGGGPGADRAPQRVLLGRFQMNAT